MSDASEKINNGLVLRCVMIEAMMVLGAYELAQQRFVL